MHTSRRLPACGAVGVESMSVEAPDPKAFFGFAPDVCVCVCVRARACVGSPRQSCGLCMWFVLRFPSFGTRIGAGVSLHFGFAYGVSQVRSCLERASVLQPRLPKQHVMTTPAATATGPPYHWSGAQVRLYTAAVMPPYHHSSMKKNQYP